MARVYGLGDRARNPPPRSYRLQSAFFSNADTTVVMQSDNIAPYLWNIEPTE